jgi:hypothetical protein
MGELLDYALSASKVTDEQVQKVRAAQAKLRAVGVKKTDEEVAILCGVLTRDCYGSLAAALEAARGIKTPPPNVPGVNAEEDEDYAGALRKQGKRKDVELAQYRQKDLVAAGLNLPLWVLYDGIGEEEGDEPDLDVEMTAAHRPSTFDPLFKVASPLPAEPARELLEVPEAKVELTEAKPPKEVIAPSNPVVTAKPPKEVLAPKPTAVVRKPAPAPAAAARPAPRAKTRVEEEEPEAAPRPPMSRNTFYMWVGIIGGGTLFLIVIVIILFSGGNYSKEDASSPRVPGQPAAVKPPESAKPPEATKPPEPAPVAAVSAPEAEELYALQDQLNARGLWILIYELRAEKDKVGVLHGEMEELGQKLAQRLSDAVRAGKSIPLGHTLRATDDLQNVEDLVKWSNATTRRESIPRLEQFLRGVKAGQAFKVSVKRDSKEMPLTLQFRADPKWPE